MPRFRAGSLWLFQLFGIDVYVHWSWLLVAFFQVQARAQAGAEDNPFLPLYASGKWYALQYLALFALVLLHEFGHALACRSVGGLADTIILWPLGGIALVRPPQRPGPLLWTAAAGPLVNLLLVPLLGVLAYLDIGIDWNALSPDLLSFLRAVWWTNLGLLLFNLIPVYPLDGGQILHGFLWLLIGRAESLMVVSILGMVVGGIVMMLALLSVNLWMCVLSAFVLFTANLGWRQGRMLARLDRNPRRADAACPACGFSPPVGDYWVCDECRTRFDTFHCRAQCPGCGKLFRETACPECGKRHPIHQWFAAPSDSSFRAEPRNDKAKSE
jgi:Zn-dependent protease